MSKRWDHSLEQPTCSAVSFLPQLVHLRCDVPRTRNLPNALVVLGEGDRGCCRAGLGRRAAAATACWPLPQASASRGPPRARPCSPPTGTGRLCMLLIYTAFSWNQRLPCVAHQLPQAQTQAKHPEHRLPTCSQLHTASATAALALPAVRTRDPTSAPAGRWLWPRVLRGRLSACPGEAPMPTCSPPCETGLTYGVHAAAPATTATQARAGCAA